MHNFNIRSRLNLILIISIFSIISAYFIEYVLGYQPCNLCLIERIPYALAIILIFVNYTIKKDEKFLIVLLIIIFIFSFSISVYHFGIEQGFFKESTVCGVKNAAEILSKEEIIKQLSKKSVSCKDVTFRIFGLSLTTINIILSLILIIILVKTYKRYEKIK